MDIEHRLHLKDAVARQYLYSVLISFISVYDLAQIIRECEASTSMAQPSPDLSGRHNLIGINQGTFISLQTYHLTKLHRKSYKPR